MAAKMRSYAKGVNKPVPRHSPRVIAPSSVSFPAKGKVDKMRRIPLGKRGK